MNPPDWLLDGHIARLNLPGLSLSFDADRPAAGLTKITVAGRPWPDGGLLGVTGSMQSAGMALTDWHVRGNDLIAVYETGQPGAAQLDLFWHTAQPAPGDAWLGRIDLLVSVHTERLDWRYDVYLESVLPQVTTATNCDGAVNVFSAGEWSLAVMVHPADLGSQELTAVSASSQLRQRLYQTESLEKGVILRAWARVWFLPSGIDMYAVSACLAEFAAADPPLGN